MTTTPLLLLHTGFGSRLDHHLESFLKTVLQQGRRRLEQGESALGVTWSVVGLLEESGFFNAGRGAIPQEDGVVRRDIGTMDGNTLGYLGIPGLTTISCPSRILPPLFGKTQHILLAGDAASRWLVEEGLSDIPGPPPFGEKSLKTWQEQDDRGGHGTVGAVARDRNGHLAATTSTGGAGRMRAGRIGDSSIPGAGTYADDRLGAVSMTGLGEVILQNVAGFRFLWAVSKAPDRSRAAEAIREILADIAEGPASRTDGRIGGILISARHGPFVFHHPGVLLAGAWRDGEKDVALKDGWNGGEDPCLPFL
ncbi:isoaspartyl peptidase/L-asparaginase [Leptospirillum ferriphilum]|uniref:Peptidase T2, asparaginase 2 n=2 Tax=Leptospirillum TaxID=179 RepID=A0A094X4S4_9BACT|nr:isoaspartyl peptidase/L-asparaginase [Leptospirillum ferriphilum]EDZ38897.1 MAG: Putative asparaginase [Leptospirillum sp. Group II '5-way CG']KGA93544.1 peptidase T2, asparaginase 2 [Leptospirillum ferriphilum]